jgi:hypothetical protein
MTLCGSVAIRKLKQPRACLAFFDKNSASSNRTRIKKHRDEKQ